MANKTWVTSDAKTRARDDMLQRWDDLSEWIFDALASEGLEGALFIELAQTPAAALCIVHHAAANDDHVARKLAAQLAGYVAFAEHGLLGRLYAAECLRDAEAAAFAVERIYTQSVVEDLVWAAAQQAFEHYEVAQNFALLARIVGDAMAGRYWSGAALAVTALVGLDAPEAPIILERFAKWAQGAAPDHPLQPSLQMEREIAALLQKRDPEQVGLVAQRQREHAAIAKDVEFDAEDAAEVDALRAAAHKYEAASHPTGGLN